MIWLYDKQLAVNGSVIAFTGVTQDEAPGICMGLSALQPQCLPHLQAGALLCSPLSLPASGIHHSFPFSQLLPPSILGAPPL